MVDRLRVRFHTGLNLLTGETGSGKSIIVDALGLLLGGRASTDMIRSGEERARVSGIFEAGGRAAKILDEAGLEDARTRRELLIEREILSNGKSRVYVNNRPATVALLKELAPHLGDIHGQHDQQLLFEPAAQLSHARRLSGTRAQRAEVRELYVAWKRVSDDIVAKSKARSRKSAHARSLAVPEEKRSRRRVCAPAKIRSWKPSAAFSKMPARLLDTAGAAFDALYESPESALSLVRGAAKKLDELAKIDVKMAAVRQSLEPALIAIQDVAYSLRDYLGGVEGESGAVWKRLRRVSPQSIN